MDVIRRSRLHVAILQYHAGTAVDIATIVRLQTGVTMIS